MRRTVCLLFLFVRPGGAQWHRFDEGRQAAVPSPLARGMLAAHNAVRARVSIAPLVWSDRLAARAQDWANTLLSRGQFFHRPNSPYGENLYRITGAAAAAGQVVKAWAAEAQGYDYGSNRCRGVCGHYTQIVWSSTREVGCAVARGGAGEVWVCNYDPPGNWVGRRPW